MKKLVIWGGNDKTLERENLDSHASVTAYFLTCELRRYYDVVNVTGMDCARAILDCDNVWAVLSTFQRGFTNRLIQKGYSKLFQAIRSHVSGPLCSVYDFNYDDVPYVEDVIFSVRPPSERLTKSIRRRARNSNIRIIEMGWCADSIECSPKEKDDDALTIFIDHPPYFAGVRDCTAAYYGAIRRARKTGARFRVFVQSNLGVVEVDDTMPLDRHPYERSQKVPWQEMITRYATTDIFCLTTPQSACLSAMEAVMCGAKLYVPNDFFGRPFIPRELLTPEIPFETFRPSEARLADMLCKEASRSVVLKTRSEDLVERHSWHLAAQRIHATLNEMK